MNVRGMGIAVLLAAAVVGAPSGAKPVRAEFGGETMQEAEERAKRLMTDLDKGGAPPSMRLFHHPRDQLKIWEVRESGLAATA